MGLVSALFGLLFLQSYVQLPNAYQRDVERDPPRFAAPCDRDNIVAINVPHGHLLGDATLSLRYDEEDRAMYDDASAVRFRIQWKW